ncbi:MULTISPECIES: LysR family transcriptional regulator [Bacillus]|uniref:LysR family transcriptional regulator n=1 Tax=Bacillus TaxID=1386 RepID=UPI001CD4690A|nr:MULTISPECIES: LysR family transcriptional regulator [Bacillus]MCA1035914.1 LysR family transcriptional regulator [Bacillus infantis]
MDIRQLTYFIEVAQQKSFTKASSVLHLTQPTLSKMVKSLEDELDIELIDRSARQIELTEAGEIVYEQGQKVIESINDLSTHLYDLMNLKKGKIKIGIPPLIGVLFFPKVIKSFKEKYPDVEILLTEHGANKVMEEVAEGLLDFGVAVLPADESQFDITPFIHEELMLYMHATSPFSQKQEVKLADLQEESFILFSEEFTLHDRITEACIKAGFRPKVAYESSQWDFISEMIAENLGIAILPPSIAKRMNSDHIRNVRLKGPSIPWRLGIIQKKGRYVSHATREFIRGITGMYEAKE